MDILRFELPYPPSVNHYYLRTSSGVITGERGKKYRRDAGILLGKHRNHFPEDTRLAVTINVFAPDKRKRDIDNLLKCTLDSIEHAGVYKNDNQIDMLTVIRRGLDEKKQGYLQIWISECS